MAAKKKSTGNAMIARYYGLNRVKSLRERP
jgi:hypothetical protein